MPVISNQFSRLQLQMFIIISDLGDHEARASNARGERWDGTVRWKPAQWFRDEGYTSDTVSRALSNLEERGYVVRIRTKGKVPMTRKVKLTNDGRRIAHDAKFGRIKPMKEPDRVSW